EILLLRITVHVDERQHGDRRLIWENKPGLLRSTVRCGSRLSLLLFVHRADKPDSLAGKGLDEALLVAAVTDRDSQCIDARADGRFRYDAPLPDRCDQIVLADDAFAVADQVFQEIEDLRLDRD